jgi:uncharacterized protein YodC (DUF2158 family)
MAYCHSPPIRESVGCRIRGQSFEELRACLNEAPAVMAKVISVSDKVAKGSRARISRPLLEGAMTFKVGDVVRLKSGGAQMTISKLFKSPERHEMVQCTWFDKKLRGHRAAFVIESLEAAEDATLHARQGGARLTD